MLFFKGEHFHSIDAKSRLTIPAKLREVINVAEQGRGFVAYPGLDRVLHLYTPARFKQVAPDFEERHQVEQVVRDTERLTYGLAEELELDALSRVLIPESMKQRCGLAREVAIVGVRDHIEVWDREAWNKFVDTRLPQLNELKKQAVALSAPAAAPAATPPAVEPK